MTKLKYTPRKSLGLLSFKGFSEVVGKEYEAKTVMLRAPAPEPWPDRFFYNLQPEAAQKDCISFERVRLVNEDPVLLEYGYLPISHVQGFCNNSLLDGLLFKTLSVRYGIEIENFEQDIRAILADEAIGALLKVKPMTPLVQLYRRYHTSVPGYHIYSLIYCNTEKYTISNYQ